MTKSDKKVGEAIPGIYINRFLVMAGPDNWRIVFIDAIEGGDGVERAHVVMSRSDIESLHKALDDLLKRI